MRRRLGHVIVLLLAVCLTTLTGCTGNSPSEPNGSGGATVVIGATVEPQTLDFSVSDDAAIPQVLLYNVYQPLLRIDSDGKLQPLLARQWTASEDRLSYTFALQPKATFASGSPVTANAVKQSLDYLRSNAKVSATLRGQLAVIKDVTVTDEHTVVVNLKHPSQFLLYNLAGKAGIVIDPAGMGSLATKPAGSGPFQFSNWTKGQSIELTRSPNYWGTPALFGSATFRYFADANALTSAMLAGDIDVISDLTTPEALNQFSDTSKYKVVTGTTNGEVVLGFNHNQAALKNLKVRQAINYAIDRKALLDTVWGGQGTMIGSMVPPTDPWYQDLSKTYPYDPAKAKQLLKEAGYASGLTLRMRVPTLPYGPPIGQFVVSALKSVGITVKLDQLEFPQWLDQVFIKGNYDMTVVNHVESRDIVNWANKSYYWHYNNATFSKLITDADQADDQQFLALMKQAAKLLATDAAGDFLFLFPHIVITRADISGVEANATTPSFDLTQLGSSKA